MGKAAFFRGVHDRFLPADDDVDARMCLSDFWSRGGGLTAWARGIAHMMFEYTILHHMSSVVIIRYISC